MGVQYFWQMRLAKRFLLVDSFVDLLHSKMQFLMSGALTTSNIRSITDSYKCVKKCEEGEMERERRGEYGEGSGEEVPARRLVRGQVHELLNSKIQF
jgi:hypothetical protein